MNVTIQRGNGAMILAREPIQEKLTGEDFTAVRLTIERQKQKAIELLSRERQLPELDLTGSNNDAPSKPARRPPIKEKNRRVNAPKPKPKPPDPPGPTDPPNPNTCKNIKKIRSIEVDRRRGYHNYQS